MVRLKAEQPKRLGEKLRLIREELNLSQDGMFELLQKYLKPGVRIHEGYISLYENQRRIPPLLTILAYSKAANVSVEAIIDDDIDLSNMNIQSKVKP